MTTTNWSRADSNELDSNELAARIASYAEIEVGWGRSAFRPGFADAFDADRQADAFGQELSCVFGLWHWCLAASATSR